jgi:hypothetical protein
MNTFQTPMRSESVQFELSGLDPDTEYRLSVVARNDLGQSRPSNQILVKTVGEWVTFWSQSVLLLPFLT